jgi:hypothetical protein
MARQYVTVSQFSPILTQHQTTIPHRNLTSKRTQITHHDSDDVYPPPFVPSLIGYPGIYIRNVRTRVRTLLLLFCIFYYVTL